MAALLNRLLLGERRAAFLMAARLGGILAGREDGAVYQCADSLFEAQAALHEQLDLPVLTPLLDSTVEAEVFGCAVASNGSGKPHIQQGIIDDASDAVRLRKPLLETGRTRMHLDTARLLAKYPGTFTALAGCSGPFTIVSQLLGPDKVGPALCCHTGMVHFLLERATEFLTEYARAFKATGIGGLVMEENVASYLPAHALKDFSSQYLRQVLAAVQDGDFTVMVSHSQATLEQLDSILESGAKAYHFGPAMDMVRALSQATPDILMCGNLDPDRIFGKSSADEVFRHTTKLLSDAGRFSNFVIGSGGEVPLHAPLQNLDVFMKTVRG